MQEEHCQHDEAAAEQQLVSDVEKYGCHFLLIEGDDYSPTFCYSVGLFKTYGHPEIICFGLPNDLLWSVLDNAHQQIKTGQQFEPAQLYQDFLADYDVQFLPADKAYYADYFGYARWFYDGDDFPVLQLVWPDKKQLFPWNDEFNPNWKFKQPLLDRNADFRFREERNLGVFVTQQVLDGQPVLYADHDEDGDWMFWGDELPTVENMKLVCFEEVVSLDPSLNELNQLGFGWHACRGTIEAKWNKENQD